jgi:predicted ATPase with chaperone activity
MCYSAQIEADYRKYVHIFGAQVSIREFARLYWERAESSNANVPKAMDDAFSNPQTDEERNVKASIEKINVAQLTKLEQELFRQRARLAEAERALQSKVTKAATESRRIANDKIEWTRAKLDDIQRTTRPDMLLDVIQMPEFDGKVLETLRELLEAGRITISRAAQQADFPAACQLVAPMNPCPCGWRGDPNGRCRYTPDIAAKYLRKLSGPLPIASISRSNRRRSPRPRYPQEAPRPASQAPLLPAGSPLRASGRSNVRERRTGNWTAGKSTRSAVPMRPVKRCCAKPGNASAGRRAYYRVLKVARTIADLAGTDAPSAAHLGGAIQYRRALPAV